MAAQSATTCAPSAAAACRTCVELRVVLEATVLGDVGDVEHRLLVIRQKGLSWPIPPSLEVERRAPA